MGILIFNTISILGNMGEGGDIAIRETLICMLFTTGGYRTINETIRSHKLLFLQGVARGGLIQKFDV